MGEYIRDSFPTNGSFYLQFKIIHPSVNNAGKPLLCRNIWSIIRHFIKTKGRVKLFAVIKYLTKNNLQF